jgi:hypothetical protein
MAIVNWIVTRIPLKAKLVLPDLTVLFRLSIAFEEEILKAGIMLKTKLKTRIPATELKIKPGE